MFGGRDAKAKSLMVVASILLMSGSVILGTAISASAAAGKTVTPTITPNTGLTNGETVTMTASGLTPGSIGNIIECNSDPNQPTVHDGGVVNSDIPVSCTAPSFSALVSVSTKGAISGTFKVVQGTNGPPCGPAPSVVTCPATDSKGKSPTVDAAAYPCPPTAAEQAIGDVCTLAYGDEANDAAQGNILFGTEAPPGTTTTTIAGATTTTGAGTTTTGAGATTTTVAGTTTTEGATTTTAASGTTTTVAATTTTEGATTTTEGATTTTEGATTTTEGATTTTTSTTAPVPSAKITGPYELYCPKTPVGDIALNGAVTSATLSPANPSAGQAFSVNGYQTVVNLPQSLASAAAALGSTLAGTATAQLDVFPTTAATPATFKPPAITFNVPIPSPVPSDGVPLSLPSTADNLPGFTASSPNFIVAEDSSASLTLMVSGAPLSLVCTAYPNNSIATSGITTTPPSGSPLDPVIAIAGTGATAPTPTTTPTTAPSTSGSGGSGGSGAVPAASKALAFTGVGPGIGVLGVIGGVLILLGFALLVLVDAPRRALASLALVGNRAKNNHRRAGEQNHNPNQLWVTTGNLPHEAGRIAKRTGRWFLGR